jgi:GH18 family chitinase
MPELQMTVRGSKAPHEASFESALRLFVRIAVTLSMLAAAQAQTAKKIVGYYYGKGRPHYALAKVPVKRLTHLIYSHLVPTLDGTCKMSHPDIDIPNLRALSA